MSLLLILIIPILTAGAVLLCKTDEQVKWTALAGSLAQLGVSVALYFLFVRERAITGQESLILFEERYPLLSDAGIFLHVGADGITVGMILLTSFVLAAGVLASWNIVYRVKEFFLLLLLLALGAFGFFISQNLFLLFFFLELSVIPKFLLISIWGSGKKEYSANKLALMLMGGSALILTGILLLYFNGGRTFEIHSLSRVVFSDRLQQVVFALLFVGFGVFTALFPFHTWVPDGHSSAPTAGSMFLAGISMKLGGFGCLKIAMYLLPEGALYFSHIIIVLSVIGILYGALATMMQKDLKYINAYSSVSHVAFSLLGMGMLTQTAITGAVMQMISHGVMTALFFAVIGMVYERTHTRMIQEMSGLMKTMPFIATVFFISGLCSLGLPGFSGFVSEMTVLTGSWEKDSVFHRTVTIAAAASLVVTAVYILRATTKIMMGPPQLPGENAVTDANTKERSAAILLTAGIVWIGLFPAWLTALIKPDVQQIMKRIAGL
ncbi:MAG: NADH-quinone oxidoreductase subunit M [Chitinophagaceae bacterium]|nr:NADH-quinone oxidoreductase subunit M [Chitinophagaceae bacterium]